MAAKEVKGRKLDKDKMDKVRVTKTKDENGKKRFVISSTDGGPVSFKEAMAILLSTKT